MNSQSAGQDAGGRRTMNVPVSLSTQLRGQRMAGVRSSQLGEAIDAAHRALQRDPNHHLHLNFRYLIYFCFGPLLKETGIFAADPADTRGVRRRLWLGIMTAEKVLPKWKEVVDQRQHLWLAEEHPTYSIELGRQILAGEFARSEVQPLVIGFRPALLRRGSNQPIVFDS